MPRSEAKIVASLKKHVLRGGVFGHPVRHLVVDADPSYMASDWAKGLKPMMRVPIDGTFPDMLATVDMGSALELVAFEVKRSHHDWLKGMNQAAYYRTAAHSAVLAFPGSLANLPSGAPDQARRLGIGIWGLDDGIWRQLLESERPRPSPQLLAETVAAVHGVAVTSSVQLNNPVHYMAAVWLAWRFPGEPLQVVLERRWPNLQSLGSRRHAIQGARILGLLDSGESCTPEGRTVAELLDAVGFEAPSRIDSRRRRLADESSSVAAVARSVLLRLRPVRLIVEVLLAADGAGLYLPELYRRCRLSGAPHLVDAFFLLDPTQVTGDAAELVYSPSMVFKFKQNLWNCGVLDTRMARSSGRSAHVFRADEDLWRLDPRLSRRVVD